MENFGLAKDIALLIVGVVAGVLPWLSDKMGIEMPKPIYVALGCLCILAMWWAFKTLDLIDKIPLFTNRFVPLSRELVALLAVAMLALWIGRALFSGEPETIRYVKTELRLQFLGGPRPPTNVYLDNVYHWYALWSPSAAISLESANKKQFGQSIVVPENWNIFLVF